MVDQSGAQTQKSDDGTSLSRPDQLGNNANVTVASYLAGVNYGRVYTFNTVDSEFRELAAADIVKVGDGMWVHVSPQTNGELPAIVP